MILSKNPSGFLGALRDGRAFLWATILTAFCIPVVKNGIQFPIILLFITWAFAPKPIFRKNFIPILIFVSIYIMHLVGMLYTENLNRGFADLEQKLSLFLFPVLFGSVQGFTSTQYRRVFWAFAAGMLVAVILSYASSIVNYRISSDILDFFMSGFSPVHHPSYISMYINFIVFFILIELYKGRIQPRWRIALWMIVLFFIISLLFSASKAGYINFIFLVGAVIMFAFFQKKFFTKTTAIFTSIVLIFFVGFFIHPLTNDQITQAAEAVAGSSTAGEIESSRARMIAWEIAVDEIKLNPFGVGTGDINDTMVRRFEQDGYPVLAATGLNPHNNFLQIGLALGIPALLIFIFSLSYPLGRIWRHKNWLYFFFLITIALHFLVESMLEKQSGVIFFAFFNAVLFFSYSPESRQIKTLS